MTNGKENKQEKILAQKKIVLMGLAEAGRNTVCKKFLNEKWVPQKNDPYHATIDYETHERTICGTKFTFFNLGGQTAFLDRFLDKIPETIFGGIDTLVFIVDVIKIPELNRAKYYFDKALEKINIYNPKALIYIFINKMDLIPNSLKEEIPHTIKEYLLRKISIMKDKIQFYETSVFNNSTNRAIEAIYRANIHIFDEDLIKEKKKNKKINETIYL